MGIARSSLLWASENRTLRRLAPRMWFVRRALSRFMPGEELDDAIGAARGFDVRGIPTTFTRLGENVDDERQALDASAHYLDALERIAAEGLDTEISVKLTALGLDIDVDLAAANLGRLAAKASERGKWVWIDMEASEYVGPTVEVYRRTLDQTPLIGLCIQAYLHRTPDDIDQLLPHRPSLRLVKGAYLEPDEVALQGKAQVDGAFDRISRRLLAELKSGRLLRYAVATHDLRLLGRTARASTDMGLSPKAWEVQMLYGIRHADQLKLAERGYPVRTLISYGPAWYPWYLRRLAEKPGENITYVLRNVFKAAPDG
jgi:proline dehydrogenase